MLPKSKMGRSSIDNPSPSDSESVTDLRIPQDLITEILLYLPVKSLVRFKCVSKPWLNLISSPRFIKSHFSTSSREGTPHFNHQLLFVARYPDSGMKHCSLSDALHNPPAIVSDIEYPSGRSVQIVGIVNGLVCVSVGLHDLYICNPILKQFKRLPSYSSSVLELGIDYGFGYDGSNDDYKVVKLSDNQGMVYSLRSDSWKIIERFEVLSFDKGTYVNGKIFWTNLGSFSRALGYTKWEIVSLDMASDKFEKMQGPCYDNRTSCSCAIGSFGGSLSVLLRENERADLWVMDENGVENSWSKVFSFPYDDCVRDPRPKFYCLRKVVCILGDGEIVLEDTLGLNVFCTKTKDFRKIQLGGLYKEFFLYVESMVAL